MILTVWKFWQSELASSLSQYLPFGKGRNVASIIRDGGQEVLLKDSNPLRCRSTKRVLVIGWSLSWSKNILKEIILYISDSGCHSRVEMTLPKRVYLMTPTLTLIRTLTLTPTLRPDTHTDAEANADTIRQINAVLTSLGLMWLGKGYIPPKNVLWIECWHYW